MERLFRWILLAAFSAGLCIELGQRSRTLLGALGLVVSLFGFLHGLFAAPEVRGHSCMDVHETVVAETFEDLTLPEAVALVGILHEYRIAAVGQRVRPRSLELRAAVELVSSASRFSRERLERAYRDHWKELRQTTAPRLLASLEAHELVDHVSPYPDNT